MKLPLPTAVLSFILTSWALPVWAEKDPSRGEFVDLSREIPSLVIDIRYASSFNFIGEPIEGYYAPKCLLTRAAAEALKPVQTTLIDKDLSLIVYDCYRPQRAVTQFVQWAKDPKDTKMQAEFYPQVMKKDLFAKGYIAARSSHSRGSTVDVGLAPLPYNGRGLDMGSPYDFFDPLSHTGNRKISPQAQKNRALLKSLMEYHGFINLPEEWWHYSLGNEPFVDQYFDFPIR